GEFSARDVAEDIALLCGKSLLWDVPDYDLVDDFIAGNRGLDALNELAAPFRAKVTVDGTTAVVRKRRPQPVQADIALTVAQLVPTNLEVVARRPQPIGLIIVTGKATPPTPDPDGGPFPPTPGGTRT